jgi:hypothetical protein
MADKSRIYLDSCCFIDAAKQAIGILPTERDADVWYIRQVLEAHKDGEIVAFTSVLTITECTHADGNIDARVQGVFSRLLTSGQYVTLVQPTPFIAADGRDLRWKHGITLSGADYLHVASGLAVKCTEFLTTDGSSGKPKSIIANAAKLQTLGLRVALPSKTAVLPAKYLQGDMLNEKVTPIRRPSASNAPP